MHILGRPDRPAIAWEWTQLLIVCVVLAAAAVDGRPVHAQAMGVAPPNRLSQRVVVDEIDSAVYAQLDRVRVLLADGQRDEAIETWRWLVQDHGDQLVRRPSQDGFARYLPLRQFVDWQLSQLSPQLQSALVEYRRRVDASVQPRWERACRERDVVQLRRIAEASAMSSYGEATLVALGDLALEAARHAEARWCYERLHPGLRWWPDDGGPPQPLGWVLRDLDWTAEGQRVVDKVLSRSFQGDGFAIPDAEIPFADALARMVLVSILEGDMDRAQTELELLRRAQPEAEGVLGGQPIVWADQLAELAAREAARLGSRPASKSSEILSWWTVAHDARRTGVGAAWSDSATWREHAWQLVWSVPLAASPDDFAGGDLMQMPPSAGPPRDEEARTQVDFPTERVRAFPEVRAQERYNYLLPTYPVAVDGTVYVANSRSLRAFDLCTGQPVAGASEGGEIFPATGLVLPSGDTPARGRIGVPRHTLTVTDHFVLARLGSAITTQRALDRSLSVANYLVCLERETQRLVTDLLLPPSPRHAFDGTPVTDGRYLFAALRSSGVTPQAHVICYDLQTGEPRWRRRVASAQSIGQGSVQEVTHNLLTMDQETGVLYLSTGLGAVAALDAENGRLRWVTTYRRTGVEFANQHQPAWHVQRDVTPCMLYRGLLMVAPPDAQQVFCLDAATGQKMWETQFADGQNDIVQLVGVVDQKLVAAGRRLWWIDTTTGQLADDVAVNPFPHAWRGGLSGCGRAVIVGAQVYWPMRGDDDRIVVFDGASGRPWRTAISLTRLGIGCGNLVAAGDRLLVAAPRSLYALAPGPLAGVTNNSHENPNRREQADVAGE